MMTNGNYTHDVVFDGRRYIAYRNNVRSKTRACEGCWLNNLGQQVTDNQIIDALEAAVPGARAEYDRQHHRANRAASVQRHQQRLDHMADRIRSKRGRGVGDRYE